MWSLSPTTLDFRSTTRSSGWTAPPRLAFTITNFDPKQYLLVEISQTMNERLSHIRYERKPVDGDSIAIGATPKPMTSASPSPSGTLTHKIKADLVVGSLNPTVSFENGAFGKYLRFIQHVFVKN
jgi:hypothetical protein